MENPDINEIYRATVENTPLCLKVFDTSGRLLFLNKAGLAEHGLRETDDLSKFDWMATVDKEYADKVRETFKAALGGKSGEISFPHSSGSDRGWCQGIFSPLKNKAGENLGVVFYSLNITDTKEKYLELEKVNQFMVERELKMIELKQRIKELEEKKSGTP